MSSASSSHEDQESTISAAKKPVWGTHPINKLPQDDESDMPATPTMPGRTHHSAPKFDGTPKLLSNFFEEVAQLAESCELDDTQHITWALRYAPNEERDLWKEVPSAEGNSWKTFKEEIYELYPGSTGDRKYTLVNLEALTDAQVRTNMETTAQFGAYYRAFTQISNFLKKKGRLSDREISGRFINGLDTSFRAKVRAQLYAENPTHHTDDPYEVTEIRKAALFVLSCNNGDIELKTLPVEPASTTVPTVKREQFNISNLAQAGMTEGFNYSALAQALAKAMSGNTQAPTPQQQNYTSYQFQNAGTGPPANNTPYQGAQRSNECIFCSETTHYLNRCPKAAEYISSGRCTRNNESQIALPNGERVNPRTYPGRNLMERIDGWHKANSTNNAALSTNMLTVADIDYLDSCTNSLPNASQFVWTEVDEDENSEHHEEPRMESEGGDIQLLQTLLNNTQKKLEEARKKNTPRGNGPITRGAAAKNGTSAAKGGNSAAQAPVNDGDNNIATSQPSMAEAALSGAPQTNAAVQPYVGKAVPQGQTGQFRYVTAIENQEATNRVLQAALNATVQVSVRDIFAVSNDIRKNVREQISAKRVPTGGPLSTQTATPQTMMVQTFMAALPTRTDGKIVSKHSQKLRSIDVRVDDRFTFEAVMDEGSQIIAIRKDLWESLGLAVRCDHQVTMESANSSLNTSVGLLQDLKFTIGGYDFYLQVQVIENAPYEILLGLPFHVLTELETKFYNDGSSHITLKDPNTGALIRVPTKKRKRDMEREAELAAAEAKENNQVLITGF